MTATKHRAVFYRMLANSTAESEFLHRKTQLLMQDVESSAHLVDFCNTEAYRNAAALYSVRLDKPGISGGIYTAAACAQAMAVIEVIRAHVRATDSAYAKYEYPTLERPTSQKEELLRRIESFIKEVKESRIPDTTFKVEVSQDDPNEVVFRVSTANPGLAAVLERIKRGVV